MSPLVTLFLLLSYTLSIYSKECIFLHGSGQKLFSQATTADKTYWGSVHNATTQCTSHVFIHANTNDYLFDDLALTSYYCKTAVAGSLALTYPLAEAWRMTGNSTVIKNKIVFSHSMGNNILAAAIKNQVCDFDLTSSTWYEVSGPMMGSKAADFLEKVCLSDITDPLYWLGSELGVCVGKNETLSDFGLRIEYSGLAGLADIMKSRISGALCGTSAFGMLTSYSVPLDALSSLVHFGEINDGMVPFSSCSVGEQHSTDYHDAFFQGPYNHADSTCRNGGVPCKWYSQRT